MLGGLVEVLGRHDPNIWVVAQHQQTLFSGEHDTA
jgi:hypothetical protein